MPPRSGFVCVCVLLFLFVPLLEGVGTNQHAKAAFATNTLTPGGGGSTGGVERPANANTSANETLSEKVLTLERLSDSVARRPETKTSCLELADALGIGHRGPSTRNETLAAQLASVPGAVFPVRDSEHRISCAYGLTDNSSPTRSTEEAHTRLDESSGVAAFVELKDSGRDALTLQTSSKDRTTAGSGAHVRISQRQRQRRWLGNDTMRSRPEPLRSTMGVGVSPSLFGCNILDGRLLVVVHCLPVIYLLLPAALAAAAAAAAIS